MLNVLVVDDSTTIRRVIKNVLQRLVKDGVTFYEAGDGEEAYAQLKAHPEVELILLDVNMPVMKGDEFLAKIRAEEAYNKIRVIMVTTEAEKKTVIRIMKLGANGFIVKPFTPEVMRKSLHPILSRMGKELNDEA
jgi:two-component system chemotaxis response regulator CheY